MLIFVSSSVWIYHPVLKQMYESRPRFDLCVADPAFPSKAAFSAFNIHPSEYLEATGGGGDLVENPIGTGPYMLDDWRRGDQLILKRNEDYWGDAPSLDGVTYRFVPDPTVAVTNVQSGEAHWTSNLPPQQVANLADSSDIVVQVVKDPLGTKGARLTTSISVPSRYLVYMPKILTFI